MLTAEELRARLCYNPVTGLFVWLNCRSLSVQPGAVAGSLDQHGYRIINLDGRSYRAARLAWLYMTGAWPQFTVDHRNGHKGDDRWKNLRDIPQGGQLQNQSGMRGVSYNMATGRWEAYINHRGKRYRLGHHDTRAAAYAARLAKQAELFDYQPKPRD